MGRTLKGVATERDVLTAARERFDTLYRRFDRVCVMFSGGKDSTVCLHLAEEAAARYGKLPVEAIFFDEEAIYPTTVEYVERVRARPEIDVIWQCFPVEHRNACSRAHPFWYPWHPDEREKWCRQPPERALFGVEGRPDLLYKTMPEVGPLAIKPRSPKETIAQVLGIRAQESPRRRMIVSRREHENWIMQSPVQGSQVQLAYPIYDWMAPDVWFYPQMQGIDYNETYLLFDLAGVSVNSQRVCPPFGEEPLAGLYLYSMLAPDMWAKMLARAPGVATAARYAKTELYSFGDQTPPAGLTYKQWTFLVLDRWPPKFRSMIAQSVARVMSSHSSKCQDPIPESDPHPVTGVSWKYLSMMASRGDMKGRKAQNLVMQARERALKRGENIEDMLAAAANELGTRY